MNIIEEGISIQELAGSQKKEINHHVFRGLTMNYRELIRMFDSLTQRYQRTTHRSPSLSWLQEEKKLYHCFLLAYSHLHFKKIIEISNIEWQQFSRLFGGKSILLLKYEAKILERSQERVRWSAYEQDLLKQCTRGSRELKWAEISRYIFFHSQGASFKTPKQCRQHWNNHMNKDISHGGWTMEEDLIILEMVLGEGRKWARISLQLRNKRTQHMIKNRFHSLLTCAKHLFQSRQQVHRNQNYLIKNFKKFLEAKHNKAKQQPEENSIKNNNQEVEKNYDSNHHQQKEVFGNQTNGIKNESIKIERQQSSSEEIPIGNLPQENQVGRIKVEEIEEKSVEQKQIEEQVEERPIGPSERMNYFYNGYRSSLVDFSMMMQPHPMMRFPYFPYPNSIQFTHYPPL